MGAYNGYTNYETWNICLWMDNDQYLYNESLRVSRRTNTDSFKDWVIEEMIAPFYEMSVEQVLDGASCASDLIGAVHSDMRNDQNLMRRMNRYGPPTVKDYLNHAMSQVNWEEVYNTRIED